jgi:uncharacterized SAM-binding protein YcdF (DUF218 family)
MVILAVETPDRSRHWLPSPRGWLSRADSPRAADLIFVLAGQVKRKEYGLELFREGLAPRILFSVGRFEIRRFSKMALPVPLDLLKIAQELPPVQRHYFAFFEGQDVQVQHIPPKRFGTLKEIEALANWLETKPRIWSILIITSGTHVRRVRMCCRALLDPQIEIALLSVPKSSSPSDAEQRIAGQSADESAKELMKILVYWPLLWLRGRRRSNLPC